MFKRPLTAGFTLIEMLVSTAIFAIVVTITVGALLMLIGGNLSLQAEQSVMTNLTFMMDNMTREIRTGTGYYCGERSNDNNAPGNYDSRLFNSSNNLDDIDVPFVRKQDCDGVGGTYNRYQGISFVETGKSITSSYGGASRIAYFFDPNQNTIKRKVGNNTPEPIVSSGIYIVRAEFFVTGAEGTAYADNNFVQPTVTIFIEAKEKASDIDSFYLQTTVTQRRLDI